MFITFEGSEGAGKSTNINYLAERLQAKGCSVVLSREPGGTKLSEKIRELLISQDFKKMAVDTELLLIFAARAEHIHQVILPALKQNKIVICDRFTDATYAYQGMARGVDEQKIRMLEELVQGSLRPDITFLFDLDAHIGLSRVKKSRDSLDRFEQEHIDFFEAVRKGYKQRAIQNPSIYRVINAGLSLQEVQAQIDHYFAEILERVDGN